ncbi:MAG: DUF3224 domain-containing protein [Chloroflexota bacterium]|nr:DUF3224 domain-containing protein [Chloroflexota bacterium]
MTIQATGTYEIKNWEEETFSEVEGGHKLTRASVATAFQGDIEGAGTLEYLLIYREEDCAYIGVERVIGRVGEREGSFVLQHDGVFAGTTARSNWSVVPGTGTGSLQGLTGKGGYNGEHGESNARFTLEYSFE